jgi:hypothetical protein
MAHEFTGEERRIKRLEEEILALQAALASVKHKAGQASEEQSRRMPEDGQGRNLLRCQSVGPVPASSGASVGFGTVRILQVINGVRYKIQPLADGDVTVDAANDTGGATRDKEFGIGAFVDGIFTLLVSDCATATGSLIVAPDPPES